MSEGGCAARLGVKQDRFSYWRRMTKPELEPVRALVPVVTVAEQNDAARVLAFVAPSGHRIEGVTLEEAIALLRVFT